MSYKDEIINFVTLGFDRTGKKLETNGIHNHVLKNKTDNFFGPKPNFKFHRWAGSLKSSQALAYNIFSGITDAKFEYEMWALDNNPLHKACIDVAFENGDNVIKMFEVKMFEFTNSAGKNNIFNKAEQQKYYIIDNYKWNKQIAEKFISFIGDVKTHFFDKSIYGEGIKQLCCHLLGIINEMTINDGKLIGKNVELYSLCFDKPFSLKFKRDIDNYQHTLEQFQNLVDNFLKETEFDKRIKFYGFLPLSTYLKDNSIFLGSKNYDYIMNRYFDNLK